MNTGVLLAGVNFVHLERGKNEALATVQVKRLSGRQRMSPIAGAHIATPACRVSTGGSQKSVDGANSKALLIPAQDEWKIVRVGKASPATDLPGDIRGEAGLCN